MQALQFTNHYVINDIHHNQWPVNYVTSLKVCWEIGHGVCYAFLVQTAKCAVMLAPPNGKSMWYFTKLDKQRRELTNKGGRAAKKWKVINTRTEKLDVIEDLEIAVGKWR